MLYTFEGWFCSAKLLDFPFFAIALFCTVQFWKHRVSICVSVTCKSLKQSPYEFYTNQCGEYIDPYIEAVKEAGNIWSVPVIDWNASIGLFPMIAEHGQYFNNAQTDLLHPNDKGHQRMARTLFYQLLTLPCTF